MTEYYRYRTYDIQSEVSPIFHLKNIFRKILRKRINIISSESPYMIDERCVCIWVRSSNVEIVSTNLNLWKGYNHVYKAHYIICYELHFMCKRHCFRRTYTGKGGDFGNLR